jgi:hypothetical protein
VDEMIEMNDPRITEAQSHGKFARSVLLSDTLRLSYLRNVHGKLLSPG